VAVLIIEENLTNFYEGGKSNRKIGPKLILNTICIDLKITKTKNRKFVLVDLSSSGF
jgi:hypothetical protein